MALVREEQFQKLTPYEEFASRQRDKLNRVDDEEDDRGLTEEESAQLEIAKYCMQLLADGVKAREPFESFDEAWDCFNGNLWPSRYPTWKARITINKIRAFVHFMQAVMVDNKPRISVEPLVPGSENAAEILRKIADRDWDENAMQDKIALCVLYGLIWGTGLMKITYNPRANGDKGAHEATPIVPYRIFTNRTATSVEDAEFIIHVEEQTMGWIWRNYPEKARVVEKFKGARLTGKTDINRDLVREGFDAADSRTIENSIRTSSNTIVQEHQRPNKSLLDDETVEVAEFWFHDPTLENYKRQVVADNTPQMEDAKDEFGLPVQEHIGHNSEVSPLDGLPFDRPIYRTKRQPKMEWATRPKYPDGRLVIMAGPVLLRDIPNPYHIDGFPFASWKCYDVGPFFGQGEVLALKDPQIGIIRMVSQMYDILEKTGNPSYKYRKGSGLETRTLKNKPGSIIPLDEIDALVPLETKQIPAQFLELITFLKQSMGEIAGLQDSVMGQLPGGNTAFATIDQLQESGAAPLRQKTRNMERLIKRCGTLRVQLIQQFDKGERPLRERAESPLMPVPDPETGEVAEVIEPPKQTDITFRKYSAAEIQGSVEYGIVPDSSLSTSPAGIWNRYMTLYDKKLIDRQAFHEKFRLESYRQILERMKATDLALAAAKAKPGPHPSKPPRSGVKPTAPPSQVPTRLQNNAVR